MKEGGREEIKEVKKEEKEEEKETKVVEGELIALN